jgi:1-acyl-sn-glycerol-3-phosphate acyltransferase
MPPAADVFEKSNQMSVFSIASPAIKAMIGRMGKAEVVNLPRLLQIGGSGAVIVCNHVGWADGLWLAYALHPRQLRFISKKELFEKPVAKWALEQSGCISLDRGNPSPGAIRTAVGLLREGQVVLVFPSGTRSAAGVGYKRGAATLALHAQVPIVPAFYSGPPEMHIAHLIGRPSIRIQFGPAISTSGIEANRASATELTERLKGAIDKLGIGTGLDLVAA